MACNFTSKNGRISNILSSIKSRAKNKNIPFNLTHKYLISIATNTCPVFEIPLLWERPSTSQELKKTYFDSPSLDRLDPQKGYIEGNVVWVSMKANYIKSNATSTELLQVAEWLKNMGY